MSFEPIKETGKSILNAIAYLKGLKKVPNEWKRAPLNVTTQSGILQTILNYGLKTNAPKPLIEYYGQDIQSSLTSMLNGKRWGILLVDWPDATGYAIVLEKDIVSGRLAIFDPSLGKYLLYLIEQIW